MSNNTHDAPLLYPAGAAAPLIQSSVLRLTTATANEWRPPTGTFAPNRLVIGRVGGAGVIRILWQITSNTTAATATFLTAAIPAAASPQVDFPAGVRAGVLTLGPDETDVIAVTGSEISRIIFRQDTGGNVDLLIQASISAR